MSTITSIALVERQDISGAAALHVRLSAAVADSREIVIDGGDVDEIDTAVVQLLVSLWRTCTERTIPCRWSSASVPLRRTATLLGVAGFLELGNGSIDAPA